MAANAFYTGTEPGFRYGFCVSMLRSAFSAAGTRGMAELSGAARLVSQQASAVLVSPSNVAIGVASSSRWTESPLRAPVKRRALDDGARGRRMVRAQDKTPGSQGWRDCPPARLHAERTRKRLDA
jgi:hypothetical protein